MMSKRRFALASWLMLAVLLFAQAAQAALPCVTASGNDPVMAFQSDEHNDEACEHTVNPNACLNQCTQDGQTSGHAELPAIAAAVIPVLTVPLEADALSAQTLSCDNVSPHVASSPPISIRFCSYLI